VDAINQIETKRLKAPPGDVGTGLPQKSDQTRAATQDQAAQ